MGLAASQARFLGLTARKSNIEYEGQQVNQQRTALAEEVNALYNSLASLKLPIAPDATDFYESNYSFSLTNTDGADGTYIVKNYYKNDNGYYTLNTERTYDKVTASGTVINKNNISTEESESGEKVYKYTPTGSEEAVTLQVSSKSAEMVSLINGEYSNKLPANDTLYFYKDSEGLTHYFSQYEIENAKTDEKQNISDYTQTNKTITETKVFENASVEYDANNRVSKIGVEGQTLDVDTVRRYDSDGYDAALRDYTMSKDEYNKKVQDLNARTESLQQEDKILEMRLDQISTEQNELKTEMEAVKSILKDNIENTFKTFA